MKNVSPQMESVWASGDYTGERRPIARVTVQHPQMSLHAYDMMSTFSRVTPSPSGMGDVGTMPTINPLQPEKIGQLYADWLFHPVQSPLEMPNVKSVSWERTIDTDAATCTIEFWNTAPLPIGAAPVGDDLDQPGYYTPGRGLSTFSKQWGHEANEFSRMLMPENVIRTYEGYGCSPEVAPERDVHLVQTGVWVIDDVEPQGEIITVTCRDLGYLLLEQMIFAPVIPRDFYPLEFRNWLETVEISTEKKITSGKDGRVALKAKDSSNTPWIGSGSISGHKLSHAFDGNTGSYWLSVGNSSSTARYAYEWIEASVGNTTVTEVHFRTIKSNYTAYVSVKSGGVWQGRGTINYHEDGVGKNGGDIKYVASAPVGSGDNVIRFDAIKNVTAIRLTLGNLQRFPGSGTYEYRAGIAELSAYAKTKKTIILKGSLDIPLKPGPAGSNPGRVQDYTDIVKLLCAWAGLYWPADARLWFSDGSTVSMPFDNDDSEVLGAGAGRVWGDFESTGTYPLSPLTIDQFDKKSLMDGIKVVQEIIGYNFFIDASGGAVWRHPNIYQPGNWIGALSPNAGRTAKIYTLDEKLVLISTAPKLSGKNIRDAVFVGNSLGKIGVVVPGFNPNPTGLRRVGGWTDQNFDNIEQASIMADTITIRQLFTYRTGQVVIPGMPAIEIDDQVRVVERVTSEGYLNYVQGVSSSLDMTTGQYLYTLQTHWLGDSTYDRWLFDPASLREATRGFIEDLLYGDGGVSEDRSSAWMMPL